MPQLITIRIDGVEGPEELELDMDLSSLTMREALTLEQTLGGESFDQLMKGEIAMRPSLIQAVVYAKLRTQRPDITADQFDLELGDLEAALEPEPVPKLRELG